jgi:hypothetical protein
MSPVLVLLLVFLVSLLSSSTVNSTTTYHVLAEGGDDCSPGNDTCCSLSYYTSRSGTYFTNNTVFHFLKGNHSMKDRVLIQKKSNIILNGSGFSTSFIECNDDINSIDCFKFIECCSVQVANLSFNKSLSAIYLKNSATINLHSLSIISGTLKILNGMELTISDSWFIADEFYNQAIVDISYTSQTTSYILSVSHVNLVNCTIRGSKNSDGLKLHAAQGSSYRLNVSLNNLNISNCNSNLYLNFSNSLCIIEMKNLTSFNGKYGINVFFSKNTFTLPSHLFVVSDSEFHDNEKGVHLTCYDPFSRTHMIFFNSSKIYNNNSTGISIIQIQSTLSVNIQINNVAIFNNTNNYIKNYNPVTFRNVSINGSTHSGLTLNDLTILYIGDGVTEIFNNTGTDGGGIALYGRSLLVLTPNTKLHIYNNTASYRGGGIFNDYNNHYNLEQLGRTFGCAYVHNMAIT